MKNWPDHVKELKGKDVNFPATMNGTNISVQLDDEFFEAFHNTSHTLHSHASSVYWAVVEQMIQTGEPGFTVDVGANHGETLRNACGEISSADSDDICNLGSVNMARINSLEEMKTVVELGTAFLLAGTVYSDVPYEEVRDIRNKNRRLGLGLMGLHEWLLKRGKAYGSDEELEKYLEMYAGNKEIAWKYADRWGLSRPVKARAIAPVGTIGIIAETTTGIEPIFCAAYKRRYRKGATLVEYQYVLDPTAKRLVEGGINPDVIEDAYTLSENIERRVAFQAWIQRYVDHGISSTTNLPAWGTEFNNHSKIMDFGNMLIKYLPRLRGITAYPDGGRSGQPLTPVKYNTAAKHVGQVFVETVDVCDLKGGSCGA
jgi:ribonucleoside-diphosphate reductase alpha chain